MKRFKYIGDEPIDTFIDGQPVVEVTKGTHVEVEDPEQSKAMEAATDSWEHIPDPKRSAAAKKGDD